MTVEENAVYGKVPCFIHVCREGKSERMSCRLITPKKKFDNFKTNYIWQPRSVTAETCKGQLYKETYQYPSRKAMKKMKAEIKRNVNSRSLLVAKEEDLIKNLNPRIIGWKNYYSTKTNEKWMQALDWYIICTFTRWYNKKHQSRNHMSKVGFVRNSIYEKGLKKMARAWRNAVERRMSESRVRENLMHGLMRGKRADAL